MENYIVINGKRTDLTEEQIKQLGIEIPKKDPFERAGISEKFFYINFAGNVIDDCELRGISADKNFAVANYCTDKALMEQRALHETLNRLLWRYSMQHEGEKIDWGKCSTIKWHIIVDRSNGNISTDFNDAFQNFGAVYFHYKDTAFAAIEEVVKPFMAEHPEFVW